MTAKRMLHLRLSRDEEGSALIEGAIVIPVIFALIVGALEFAYFSYEQHIVSTGVRDAARFLARTTDPTAGAAQTAARNLASTGSIAGGAYRRITGFDPADVTITFPDVANDDGAGTPLYRVMAVCGITADNVRIINVTGTFVHTSLGFLEYFGFSPPTITVIHRERCIGLS